MENNKISGAEAVIRCLLEEGVDLVYGYPGGAIMPVYDELYKFQDQLHHVLVRHEQGAAHAAQGFARATGKVGVAIATSGPGATNLVTGIADAQIDSTPLVCINTAVTNITHSTTGATGIGNTTGLPPGVTASWASNTITIGGTPTASGTFNYSIPLTGGCGSVSATGTITVTPSTAGLTRSIPWADSTESSQQKAPLGHLPK